jgi:hypothetical protein
LPGQHHAGLIALAAILLVAKPVFTADPPSRYGTGAPNVTVWKGFQRKHAEGLELLRAPAADAAAHTGS